MNLLLAVTGSQVSSAWQHVYVFLRFAAGVGIAGGVIVLIRQAWSRGGSAVSGPFNDLRARFPARARTPLIVAAIACAYLLPMWDGLPLVGSDRVDVVALLCQTVVPFVIIALGLNIVVGMAGLLDLGYVGFYAVGAYTVGILTSKHASLPWLVSVPIAVVVTLLFGVLLGAPTLRLRGDYLARRRTSDGSVRPRESRPSSVPQVSALIHTHRRRTSGIG